MDSKLSEMDLRDSEQLATKQDISALEVKMWRMAAAVTSLAVLLNKFLAWAVRIY